MGNYVCLHDVLCRDCVRFVWLGNSEDSKENQQKAKEANQKQANKSVEKVMNRGDWENERGNEK